MYTRGTRNICGKVTGFKPLSRALFAGVCLSRLIDSHLQEDYTGYCLQRVRLQRAPGCNEQKMFECSKVRLQRTPAYNELFFPSSS